MESQSLVSEDLNTLLIPSTLISIIRSFTTKLQIVWHVTCSTTNYRSSSVHWGSVALFSFGLLSTLGDWKWQRFQSRVDFSHPIDHKTINTVHLHQDSCRIFQHLENQFTAFNPPCCQSCVTYACTLKWLLTLYNSGRARYRNTMYACWLLVFPSSNPQQIKETRLKYR